VSAVQAAVLGLIQGLGEFLPISSSAHLAVIPPLTGWPDQGLAYDVALHWGTLLAVVLYFWKDLLSIAKDGLSRVEGENKRLFDGLILATIPGVIAGLAFENLIESYFRAPERVGLALAAFGILLGIADRCGAKEREAGDMGLRDFALIGIAQAFAIVPGVSRSGVTMTAALALGLTRVGAARFSFLMAVPIVAGAGVLKAKELLAGGVDGAFFLGVAISFASGLGAIGFLMNYLKRASFSAFAVYRVLFGAFLIWFSLAGPGAR
jgi:undecaprenyl-diphosphatase